MNMYTIFLLVLVSLSPQCFSEETHKIGGIFYKDSDDMKIALEVSAQEKGFETSIKEVSKRGEILEISGYVCELAQEGVIGIIDGTSGRASENVQAICDVLDLPHVMVQHNDLYSKNWTSINLFPSPDAYNMVLESLILEKEWRNFTILYIKGNGLLRVSDLMQMGNSTYPYVVTVRELSGDDYREVLIDAKHNGYVNFVVDCPSRNIEQLLLHAQQVGLMADEHSYIFVSPDLFTVDMERYKYGGVNMTGLRLIDLTNPDKLFYFATKLGEATLNEEDPEKIKTVLLLISDAVEVFAGAIKKMERIQIAAQQLSCDNYDAWVYGTTFRNFMKTNKVEGITRSVIFNGQGQRTDIKFELLELTSSGNETIGKWEDNSLKITRPVRLDAEMKVDTVMKNKTLLVLISTTPPYTFRKDSLQRLTGNDQFEGFAIDIIEKLSEMLEFNYVYQVETNYGKIKEDGKFNGMARLLIDEKADLAICDLTMTAERQKGIDFSTPFMTLGIGILYKQPSKQPPAMFSFMEVFSKEVWYYMMLIQFWLGIVLIFVGRISHKEWQNPVPCIEQPEELSNQFSFANSVWLIIGSVMQQGSEIAPIALGPRLITSVWWFFTMVMVASYVGTLVAFLTVEKNVLPFNNVQELYKHKSIKYGTKAEGSTRQFFQESTDPTYAAMYQKMLTQKWLVGKNEDGVYRVENEQYAFFMESASIEYVVQRNCDLLQIGGLLDSKSYGIGMKKKSPYKKYIDDALLKLKEQGEIDRMKNLWWNEKRGGGKCVEGGDTTDSQLGMKHMLGAFVVLGGGCVLGLIISILTMLWAVFKRTVKYQTTFKYELIEELKFAITFSGNVKPVKRPKPIDGSIEALANAEGKDDLCSLKSLGSGKTANTHSTHNSHRSRHSSRSLSVAFARRRKYS